MEKESSNKSLTVLPYCIGLLFAMPLLPSHVKSVAIAIFLGAVLWYAISNKARFNPWFFITNAGFFLLLSLTYSYSTDGTYALRKLGTMSTLVIFPLAFSLISKEHINHIFKNRHQFLLVYLIAVFLFNLIPFIWFYCTLYNFSDMLTHFPTLMQKPVDVGKWNIHPIYLSMHCSIAILFGFYIVKELKSKLKIIAVLLVITGLIAFLFLYAKKGPMLALVVVFTLFVLFQKGKKLASIYTIAILTFVALLILIPRTRDKFLEMQHIEVLQEDNVTSTNIRYTIYQVSKELITEAPWFGYGIGDFNNMLDHKYQQLKDKTLIGGSYNSHNQYFSLLLMGGMLVLVAFIIMMGMNMVFAIRFNNQLLILTLVFYGIIMLTENILEREAGVIFFAFFLNFFGSKSLYIRED